MPKRPGNGPDERTKGSYAKGLASREAILAAAQALFNEHGAWATLDDLARKLGCSKGRITHHFGTKEALLQALMARSSEELDRNARDHGLIRDIGTLAQLYRKALDIIDTYRVVYLLNTITTTVSTELDPHVEERMDHRLEVLRPFIRQLVEQGILTEEANSQRSFDAIAASTVLGFIGWPMYRATLARGLSYQHARSVMLRSCLHVLAPYFTDEGLRQYRALLPTI